MAELPNQQLKDYLGKINKPQLADKMANQPVEWNDLSRMFEASVAGTAEQLTTKQRGELINGNSPLRNPPYDTLTWNQLLDPANTLPPLKLDGKDFDVLGSIRQGLNNPRNTLMSELMTKGFQNGVVPPIMREREQPSLTPPFAPNAPDLKKDEGIKINLDTAIERAGVVRAVLAPHDSAPPVPDVRSGRSL